jgi:hypothetical protein
MVLPATASLQDFKLENLTMTVSFRYDIDQDIV